jgi:hypothetical protein
VGRLPHHLHLLHQPEADLGLAADQGGDLEQVLAELWQHPHLGRAAGLLLAELVAPWVSLK